MTRLRVAGIAALFLLTACSRDGEGQQPAQESEAAEATAEEGAADHDIVHLSPAQIQAAGIELVRVSRGGSAGVLDLPAVISADPARTVIVAAAVTGRVVSVLRNLGEQVNAGAVLAVIESQEAADLKASVEAAESRVALAESTFQREERLFQQKVSPEQDYLSSRAARDEARIALRLAQQRLISVGGGGGGDFSRLEVRTPLGGRVIERNVVLGAVVRADAELFHIADLSEVTAELMLDPATAARVQPGSEVTVSSNARNANARIAFISPVLDAKTRQVRAIATLDNRSDLWRVGETVQATIRNGADDQQIFVPLTAIQTVEGKPSVFVRIAEGFSVRHLTIGTSASGQVAVTSGLDGDELIASSNSYVLKAEIGKGEGGEHEH